MNRDDVIRMAREAGDVLTDKRGREEFCFDDYGLEEFAASIVAAERKRIADMLRADDWFYCATLVELRKK